MGLLEHALIKALTRPSKTSQSWNVVCFTICHIWSHMFIAKGSPGFGLFYPVLKHVCIGQGHPMGFQSNILVGQVIWQKHIPVNALLHRAHSEHMASKDLTSDWLHLEGCVKLLGQLLDVPHAWCGGQLLPPVGFIQLAGPPFQPLLIVSYWWLCWKTPPIPGAPAIGGHLQEVLQLWP